MTAPKAKPRFYEARDQPFILWSGVVTVLVTVMLTAVFFVVLKIVLTVMVIVVVK